MPWDQILTTTFLIAILTAGIRLAVPVLLAVLGEIITQLSGVMNLGLEGIMLVGGLAGFATTYALQQTTGLTELSIWLGLLAGLLAGMLMGLVMAILSITCRTDQVIAGITLVLLGQSLTTYFYREYPALGKARVTGLAPWPIPGLSQIPVVGDVLFNHSLVVYLSALLVMLCWFLLYRTRWGLQIRATGEHPAVVDTSGLSVITIRYLCTLAGSALAGFGGAVLTVVQLNLFIEGVTAGRGWIAIALVFFSRWQPGLALFGALLFGIADAIQFRIQALGSETLPYEFLLMLPYLLTLLVLVSRRIRDQTPTALGIPYIQGKR
ncbi:ABC transporter permease [Oculatella sp. FACHB-28]|uniref:ABC transporter permease n=1 Tax=Oculatella sp. FACHB-28 TaxID=2692845 RepID=UPI0016862C9A|nr:ABC transporter permease [Oculatella sp. FACHB-28]MBD2059265.1 ABC transporter permease [Oculatella sp. FACHB-28]